MQKDLFESMSKSIIEGENEDAKVLAQQALDTGIKPLDAINQGFIVGMNHVGEQFSLGQLFIPDLVISGEAMKAALSILEPEMVKRGTEREVFGKVVLATIQGDIHDIGKTLVGIMLSANGFQVFDMGVDVPMDEMVQKVRDVDADIVAVSALLTTTMINQKTLIEKLDEAGLRSKIKILVGGAPVNQDWADEIGADGYSKDAIGAVTVAKHVLNDKPGD